MGLASRRPSPRAQHVFVTWLVAGAGSLTGVPPLVAVLFALLLTLLLLNRSPRASRVSRSGMDVFGSPDAAEGRAFFLDDEWESWIEKYLPKLRAMRRRMRGKLGGHWLPTVPSPVKTDPISAHLPRKREPRPRRVTRPGADRASGLLLLSALLASLLTVFTLISESSRLVEQDARLFVFRLLEVCGVVALPIVVGLVFRFELHSTLATIALSALVQLLLFHAAAMVPDELFLGVAMIAFIGIPLAFAWLFSRLDRRPEGSCDETTTGRLLESKYNRMSPRQRACLAGRNEVRPSS